MNIAEKYSIGRCSVTIAYDEDASSPRENDNVGTMCCWHRRYTLGDEQPDEEGGEYLLNLATKADPKFAKQWEKADNLLSYVLAEGLRYLRVDRFVARRREEVLSVNFVILPLYLYDHSGISMSTGAFSCPWDSGQVGFIYCLLKNAQHEYREALRTATGSGWDAVIQWDQDNKKTLREAITLTLESEVKTYDSFIRGNCYGYIVEAENGEEDSCWGFIGGLAYVKSEAADAAKHLNEKMDEEDRIAVITATETELAEIWP